MGANGANAGIARKTAGGVMWNGLSFVLGKGLVFITTAILARLLTPADFGIVAMAALAVNYLAILKDFGLGAALIQYDGDVVEAADTVFTLNLILGIILSVVAAGISPWAAQYFNQPAAAPLLGWLGITFIINALGAVHLVRLQRQFDFRRKLIPDLVRSTAKGVTAITLALLGFGVWALVWGQIAGTIAGTLTVWLVFPWRPRLRIGRQISRQLLRFGINLLGVDALAVVIDNLDYLIIGRFLSVAALGIYTLAYRLPELLVMNILWVVAAAIFPAYARLQRQPSQLRHGFLLTLSYVEMAAVPLSLGLMIAADPLVRLVFGEQWLAAVPLVRVLALFVLIRSIGSNVGDIYKAVGRPDILLKLGGINFIILLISLLIGVRFGLIGVAWGHVIAGIFRTTFRLFVAARILHFSFSDLATALRPTLLAGAGLLFAAVPVAWLTIAWPPGVQLFLIGLAGASTYISILFFNGEIRNHRQFIMGN